MALIDSLGRFSLVIFNIFGIHPNSNTMTNITTLLFNIDKTASKVNQVISGQWVRCLSLLGVYLLLAFTQQVNAENTGQIMKWVDDKGAIHYADSVPAEYSNSENTVINRQGITVKHNKPVIYQDKTLDVAKQIQDRKDKVLLSTFTHEDEIDLARDRNLQMDQMTLENLQLERASSVKQLGVNKQYVEKLLKRKMPIPADLNADISHEQANIAKQDLLISARKANIVKIRKLFDDDKKRYIALKNHTAEIAVLPEVASSNMK